MKKMTKTEIRSAYAKALRSKEVALHQLGLAKAFHKHDYIEKHNLEGRYSNWAREVTRLETEYPWLTL